MQLVFYCAFAAVLSVVTAGNYYQFEASRSSPIHLVFTSFGALNHERVDYLEARIFPYHINTRGRHNFPSSGFLNDYFMAAKAPGDERGHLVASQFSGPAAWYNLSPQNARVNRNKDYQAITTDWYGAECEVRNFLNGGECRFVQWIVRMTYIGDSNRPTEYHLQVNFVENGVTKHNQGINTIIHNPLKSEDSTFWVCRVCRSNFHGPDSPCTRQVN